MKKLPLFAALCAASLCTVAGAQTVSVYGKLYPFVITESGSGQTAAGTPVSTLVSAPTGAKGVLSVKGMSAGNSHLGFRGFEDLGGGLKAEFQIEGTVAVDTGNAAGFLWNRNTFVGLNSESFGEIRLGIMDTVFKEYGDTLGILGISSGTPMSSSNILRKTGFGTSSASRFHERRPNTIRYDSPEVAGFQGGLQVATGEVPAGATGNVAPAKTYSLGLKYDLGPWYFSIAHEIHTNWFGGSANAPAAQRNNGAADFVDSRDKATQFTVEWRLSKEHKLEFDVIRKNYKENAVVTGRFQSYQNMAYLIASDSRIGPWRIDLQFVKAQAGSCSRLNAVCSTDGLDGTKFTGGAAYYLSKRTFIYGVYDQIKNGKSARYSNTEFNTPNSGEDIRHFIAGMSTSF